VFVFVGCVVKRWRVCLKRGVKGKGGRERRQRGKREKRRKMTRGKEERK